MNFSTCSWSNDWISTVNFCREKANVDTNTNNIKVSNNSFEVNSGPVKSTEITVASHAGRCVAPLPPSDDLLPPLYYDLHSNPPPSYLEVMGRGVDSAKIPTSPAPSHQSEPEQESTSLVIINLTRQGRGTRSAGSLMSRALAYRPGDGGTNFTGKCTSDQLPFYVPLVSVALIVCGLVVGLSVWATTRAANDR